MLGRIIDLDKTDAFILFLDGTTMDINVSRLPHNVKIGDSVDIPINNFNLSNDKMDNFY